MIDGHGRNIDYIRISVTDRCNLRCTYCMPEEGIPVVDHQEILSYDEITKLAEIFADIGIRKIKLTGGEPLVRKGLPHLVKQLKSIPGVEQVTLTTNGVMLEEMLEELALAGLDGINLSLDTLNSAVFEQITRRQEFSKVMSGLKKALSYPEIPLKINCVPMGLPGQNVYELAELARKYRIHVRYIEMMPIGLGKQFKPQFEEEILAVLEQRYGKYEKYEGKLGNGPGHYYTFPGFIGKIGFISAISHKFCNRCNRVRLTSQGFLKTCLQYETGIDLKKMLRQGAGKAELRMAIEEAIERKQTGHQFGESSDENGETHMMSQIGG
ncbi:MAG: GTP 3',8-cyclase MoaA [Oliverpabstia sp.]